VHVRRERLTSHIDVKGSFPTATIGRHWRERAHPGSAARITRLRQERADQTGISIVGETRLLPDPVVVEGLRLCHRWRSPPFNSRQHGHHDGDNEQSDHNHPLHRAVVLIWIPTLQELDPVRKYWSNKRQQTSNRGQANFYPEQAPKIPSHLNPSKTSTAPALDGRRVKLSQRSSSSSSSSSSQHG
jgi:hypothetical protein